MLSRRSIVSGGLAAALHTSASSSPASSRETCNPTPFGTVCRAEVAFETLEASYSPQEQSQWCWAACISMVFAHAGKRVSQERIVEQVYHRRVNLPAMTGGTITAMVNRRWRADNGSEFTSRVTGLFDAQAGAAAINNAMIVNELRRERPLIVGARTHAMVATAVDYIPTPMGPNIQAVGVFDPWPGRGPRALMPDEARPVFLGGSLIYLVAVTVS